MLRAWQDEVCTDEDYVHTTTIRDERKVAIGQMILWSDSKTVQRWIGSTHRRYKQFVGNRVAEILEPTDQSNWNWIPSAENVADEETRAQRHVDFSQQSRWLGGPAFLRGPEANWPQQTPSDDCADDDEEMPCEFALTVSTESVISLQRFSSYTRLVRTVAWVLRFARWCQGQQNLLEKYGLTAAECEAAEYTLIRQAQREAFPDEVQAAQNKEIIAKGSDVKGLAPYLDGKGVLRAYGRI
ncbi:uncharacterized protein LOC117134671 [Drosophila busckii]|uniref:uncharacterized protein LOC117134671 n=1 Tax=Drosophila busckii TaxID=30019 RepID=UPI001432DB3E|nr:uncharacterized protein LOC117134671 [Drosophila busckii]